MRRRLVALLVVVCSVLMLASCQASGDAAPAKDWAGTRVDGLWTLPGTTLVATDGSPRALSATKPVTLLFFGYANCPDVCTGIIADLAAARNRMSDADRRDVDIVVVTTDPARDTPQALGAYLERIDPGVVGLTGELPAILEAGSAVGVDIAQGTPLPSGGYEVQHSTQVIVFDGQGSSRLVWTTGKSIGEIRSDVEKLLAEVR